MIYSFSYPNFNALRYDPLHFLGFTIAHLVLMTICIGFIVPRWYDVFIPSHRQNDGDIKTVPNIDLLVVEARKDDRVETGMMNAAEDSDGVTLAEKEATTGK